MAQNNEEIFLNQFTLQKTAIKNTTLCERCKINKCKLFCEECQPFHNYCNQCDTAVHELPSRSNHNRIQIYLNPNIINIQNKRSNNKNELKKNNSTKILFYTPKNYSHNSLSFIPNDIANTINNNLKNNNLNSYLNGTLSSKTPNTSILNQSYTYVYNKNGSVAGVGLDDCKKVYTKDYVNELKIMHEKEKEELLYKINSLEKSINRIKSSLNEEIAKVKFTQITTEKECNDKIEQIYLEYNSKIENLEKEKDYKNKEILSLNQEILEQKKKNENLFSSYEEIKNNFNNLQNEHKLLTKEYNNLENKSKKDNDNINQKLLEVMKSYEQYKEQSNIEKQNIINENRRKINDILKQKELEIKEINLNNKENIKNELNNLNLNLTEKYEKIINDISNENNILRQDNTFLVEKINFLQEKINQDNESNKKNMDLLKNENEEKNKKINDFEKNCNEINYKNKDLENIITDLKNQNNELKQKNNENIKEINNLKENNLTLNNEIKNVKLTNEVISNKINKLQEENRKLKVDFDTIDIEYNNKLKNYKFIEDRNSALENENEKLRNKIDLYIKPLAYNNYTYIQK